MSEYVMHCAKEEAGKHVLWMPYLMSSGSISVGLVMLRLPSLKKSAGVLRIRCQCKRSHFAEGYLPLVEEPVVNEAEVLQPVPLRARLGVLGADERSGAHASLSSRSTYDVEVVVHHGAKRLVDDDLMLWFLAGECRLERRQISQNQVTVSLRGACQCAGAERAWLHTFAGKLIGLCSEMG